VECYAAGLIGSVVADDADRMRAAVEVARQRGAAIEYLGALFVAGDEAVFHTFRADDQAVVETATRRAGVRHTRIVESVAVVAPGLADALSRLLGEAAEPDASGLGQ